MSLTMDSRCTGSFLTVTSEFRSGKRGGTCPFCKKWVGARFPPKNGKVVIQSHAPEKKL